MQGRELKIDPKFRDLIPKLTEEEYSQLEKNILEDGRIKEPIVVWNGTIIDGHHRYYIAQKHPEIPYEIEEKDFPNEYAAMAWACANQLGRRNLNDKDRDYLIGKQYEEEKKAHVGGDGSNQFKKMQDESSQSRKSYVIAPSSQSGSNKNSGTTASRIAEENGVTGKTVWSNSLFSRGVDIANSVVPGLRDDILRGRIDVPKNVIQKLPKVTADKQRKAAIAISNGDIAKAKKELLPEPEPMPEPEPYNIDDLIEEVKAAEKQLNSTLNQTLFVIHGDILKDVGNQGRAIGALKEIKDDIQNLIFTIENK